MPTKRKHVGPLVQSQAPLGLHTGGLFPHHSQMPTRTRRDLTRRSRCFLCAQGLLAALPRSGRDLLAPFQQVGGIECRKVSVPAPD